MIKETNNSIFTDENGNGVIERKLEPAIYRFLIPNFSEAIGKTSTKVGYTVQHPMKRTGQWQKMGGIYDDLSSVDYVPAFFVNEDGEKIYYMDHAVHHLIEADGFAKVTSIHGVKEQFPNDHISKELFYNKTDSTIEIVKSDLVEYDNKLQAIYKSGDYRGMKFYKDFRESPMTNVIHFSASQDFAPRKFQQDFIDNSFNYFVKNFEKDPTENLSYLLSAPTRSGKSFMSASLSLEIVEYLSKNVKKNNLILVLSGIADVGTEWQETYEVHKKFNQRNADNTGATKIAYVTRNELLLDGADAVKNAYESGAENVVVFLTLQDLNGSYKGDKGENFIAHDFLKPNADGNSPVDFMIVDEAHFAAFNQYGEYRSMIVKNDFEKFGNSDDGLSEMTKSEFDNASSEFKSIVPTVGTLFVSATPYNELIGGSTFSVSKKNMTIFSKKDIQDESAKWDSENTNAVEWMSPYYGIPKISSFAVDTGEFVEEILKLDNRGEFINHESANSMIWNFFGREFEDCGKLYPMVTSDPIYTEAGMGKHIIITVPSCAIADAVEKSLNKLSTTFNDFEYYVMNVSSADGAHEYRSKDAYAIKNEIAEFEKKGQKTVVITVDRLTTGVTVKEWDTTVFWRNMSSAQKFDQFKGRNGTPYVVTMMDDNGTDKIKRIEKQNAAIISYAPQQILDITYKSAVATSMVKQEEGVNESLENLIEDELSVSPTYLLSGGDHMVKMTANNILESVLEAQKEMGPRECAEKVEIDVTGIVDNENIMKAIDSISRKDSKLSISVDAFSLDKIEDDKCQFVHGCEEPVVGNMGEHSIRYCSIHLSLLDGIEMDKEDEGSCGNETAPNDEESGLKDGDLSEETINYKDSVSRIRNYISLVLMFVALSDNDENGIDDVIAELQDENNVDSQRIAQHLGINRDFLQALRDNGVFNYTIDLQIYLINKILSNIDEDSSVNEKWDAMNLLIKGFGNFSENEIPTNGSVAELVISKAGFESSDWARFNKYGVKVIDNGAKSAVMLVEFAKQAMMNNVSADKLNLSAVPTSPATYELVRKVYEVMGWDIDNIYFINGVENTDMNTMIETAFEMKNCQRDFINDCPIHGNNQYAKNERKKLNVVTRFPYVKNKSNVEKISIVEDFANGVIEKIVDNIIGKIEDADDRSAAESFWEKLVSDVEKFDYCISNPPYQLEGGGGGSNALNIYPNFMISGKRIAKNSIMIHPARAFLGAGRFNADIVQEINDSKSFKCLEYIENASGLFPTAMIKGGLMISSYKENTVNPPMIEELIPKHLLSIQKKVINKEGFNSILNIMGSYNDNKFSDMAYEKHKEEMDTMKHTHTFVSNVFTNVSSIFENKEQNDNDYVSVLGIVKNKRTTKWINKKYVVLNSEYKDKWKVFVPGSMGAGVRGEKISDTFIGKPNMIATQTFIPFGLFDTEHEAMNFEKYLKSKFARALLSILKVTPSNGRKTWVNIPQIDFTEESEIDWNKDIDEQLYEMYDLTDEEKEWINKSILSMN